MLWFGLVAWWMAGISSMLWLQRGGQITWGLLAGCLVIGFLGPAIWLMIGFVALWQADFWDKPVFGKRQSR